MPLRRRRGARWTPRVETLAEQSSRLAVLTELQENHEGFYQGVRAVLNAEKRGQLRGHYKAVVDLLTVPEPYRVAIEVALGGSLQDIVTTTEAEAKAGIEWLKQNRAGRATFLALPLLRGGTQSIQGVMMSVGPAGRSRMRWTSLRATPVTVPFSTASRPRACGSRYGHGHRCVSPRRWLE